MSIEVGESERVAFHFNVLVSQLPTFDLPTLEDGNRLAPELAAFQDFVQCRPQAPTLEEQGSDAASSKRLRLPHFSAPSPIALAASTQLKVDTTVPAIYGRALAQFDDATGLDVRFTFRPQAHYLVVASYVAHKIAGSPEIWAMHCYSFRTLPFADGDEFVVRIEAILREELVDLAAQRRSPAQPYVGLGVPLLDEFSVAYQETVRVSQGLADKPLTITFDEGRFLGLRPDEQLAVREVIKLFAPRAPLPDGPRQKARPETVLPRFDATLGFFEALLKRLPSRKWRPFNTPLAALTFLKQSVEATELEIGVILGLLMRGQRRPSPRTLAVRFLHETTGLSETRIYELIRR
jgi:hypothetical protein